MAASLSTENKQMRILSRVLGPTATAKGLGSQICSRRATNLERRYCNRQSLSSTLINRLKEAPHSRIKVILDSEENFCLSNFDFSWAVVVASLKSSSATKAQLALEWRLEKMLKDKVGDQDQYSELISLCGEINNVPLAMSVFRSMESIGTTPNSDIFNSLIAVCFSSGNELTALSLFEIMVNSDSYKPNSKTYNLFMAMYSKKGDTKAMQAWASAKAAAGFAADLPSYESLISGCVRARDFEAADRHFEEMMSSGILPNTHILEKLLHGLCERRMLDNANEFLNLLLHNGWDITVPMADRLVSMYTGTGNMEAFEGLLEALSSAANQSPEVLSRIHCGIIKMHAMADRLDDVGYCVGRMLKQGMSFKSDDDVEKIVCCYFRRSAYDRLELFLEHIKDSYKFTRSTYGLLAAGYRRAGMLNELDWALKHVDLAVS